MTPREAEASATSFSVIAPTALWMISSVDLARLDFFQRLDDGLDRTLVSALTTILSTLLCAASSDAKRFSSVTFERFPNPRPSPPTPRFIGETRAIFHRPRN